MPEAPETPAPVFAIRAFKSALFGTPGGEDDGEAERTLQSKHQHDGGWRSISDSLKPSTDNTEDTTNAKKSDFDTGANTMASPTKSILLTPGTASNRRKTVSFGDGVVDNERKRDVPSRLTKTPPSSSGTVSSQWMSGSSDGKDKPRSKLTQSLLDARDNSPRDSGSPHLPRAVTTPADQDNNDDTVNLNEPRSESGKYWKAEFDSYRTKTANEIKKLIQYRSVAKSYARKKDEEASRLAEKLREEEQRVVDMERHVSQLASKMVGEETKEGAKADKEQLVQDLTKQTALALQYKHRVSLLRRILEEHGVVDGELDVIGEQSELDSPPEKTAGQHRRTQQGLEQANAKIKDQQVELEKLRNLAHSSEEKASKLDEENMSLKHTLARVKKEMNKYEGRRLEKEGKLKQREAKLEARVKEYRERLKRTSQEYRNREQEHRTREEDLKAAFDEERCHLVEKIHFLTAQMRNTGLHQADRAHERHAYKPHTSRKTAQVQDFEQYPSDNETDESEEPPSPSPRSKERAVHHPRTAAIGSHKSRRIPELDDLEDYEGISSSEEVPVIQPHRRRDAVPDRVDKNSNPCPNHRTTNTETVRGKQRHSKDSQHTQELSKSHAELLRQLAAIDDRNEARAREQERLGPLKYSLDAITRFPRPAPTQEERTRENLRIIKRAEISVERMLAAQARLKQKDDARRKAKHSEKENIVYGN